MDIIILIIPSTLIILKKFQGNTKKNQNSHELICKTPPENISKLNHNKYKEVYTVTMGFISGMPG